MYVPTPRATYRLQLHRNFDLEAAAEIVDYLAALGVSHVYVSPLLQAASGSSHGYDVVDHQRVNRELGGEEALLKLGERLRHHGLALVLDVVPDHMAATEENSWWWDVLENGPTSRFASYFDLEWDPPEARVRNRVLVPILADHYGRALEAGDLGVERDGGNFLIRHRERVLPISPRSLDVLLREAADRSGSRDLAFLAEALAGIPLPTAGDAAGIRRWHRDQGSLRRSLAWLLAISPDVAKAVDARIEEINGDVDALDALLERQNWRVAHWRTGDRELGYRRVFDVDDRVALRVEDPLVFSQTHAVLLTLGALAPVHGLRIDHVDGLRDPTGYLERLRIHVPDAWIVVEKILMRDEQLPEVWPVAGTTGYEFLNLVGGLFVDPAGGPPLRTLYAAFTGESRDYATVAVEKKAQLLQQGLCAGLARVTALLVAVCDHNRRYRDFTRHEVREALYTTITHFPVYRTYVRAHDLLVSESDARAIRRAIAAARRARPDLDPGVFDLLSALLLREIRGDAETEFVLRFQQLCGPAQAKGVEDTALYAYGCLASLCEVGGDPGCFGVSLEEFHAACGEVQARWPDTLLTTSTHDTQRGEDVRARLHLLSEIPGRWAQAVTRWSASNEAHRRGGLPDRACEYLFYQTLVGAWPIGIERVLPFLEKANREAGAHTSWTDPDEAYERAVRGFARQTLEDPEFVGAVEDFVRPLVLPGRVNSLAQTLLKLAAPGVPDLYQGSELWDASLVDPDNRRPVDFLWRRRLLAGLEGGKAEEIWSRQEAGLPKLWLVQRALDLRRRRPDLFGVSAAYEALRASGEGQAHVVAFARGGGAIAIAPRLVLGLDAGWGDTLLPLPPGSWRDVLSGAEHGSGAIPLAELLARFPVALLENVAS
jgi:(1->4)-alpha-D-glucan 1-alpha-D-glucosylmutase